MKKAILIIDDDQRNIFALSAILKARGYRTNAASGMAEAFAALEKGTDIDIILLDMMMPDMDGYQAIPRIKADPRWQHIPVVAVTAQAMNGDREKCIAAGADDYLPKPVDIDKLVDIIETNR